MLLHQFPLINLEIKLIFEIERQKKMKKQLTYIILLVCMINLLSASFDTHLPGQGANNTIIKYYNETDWVDINSTNLDENLSNNNFGPRVLPEFGHKRTGFFYWIGSLIDQFFSKFHMDGQMTGSAINSTQSD